MVLGLSYRVDVEIKWVNAGQVSGSRPSTKWVSCRHWLPFYFIHCLLFIWTPRNTIEQTLSCSLLWLYREPRGGREVILGLGEEAAKSSIYRMSTDSIKRHKNKIKCVGNRIQVINTRRNSYEIWKLWLVRGWKLLFSMENLLSFQYEHAKLCFWKRSHLKMFQTQYLTRNPLGQDSLVVRWCLSPWWDDSALLLLVATSIKKKINKQEIARKGGGAV